MNRDLGEGGSRTPRQERPPGERGKARTRGKEQPRNKRARSQRQTVTVPNEHESNDVRSQDAEQCEESDARHLLSPTFAETTTRVILMTWTGVDCQ